MRENWERNEEGFYCADVGKTAFKISETKRGAVTHWKLEVLNRYGWCDIGATIAPTIEHAKLHALDYSENLAALEILGRRSSFDLEGRSSPWGKIQSVIHYAPGIVLVETAGHGGFKLDAARNRAMPKDLRIAGGWYEEDAEWALVAIGYPLLFTQRELRQAQSSLKAWNPDTYEAHFNVVLQPGESRVKDDRLFYLMHASDYLVISAINSSTSPGMVEVIATIGAQRGRDVEEKKFLVSAREYDMRGPSFIVDLARHVEILMPTSPGPR